jgi:hypothetical protein
MAHPFRNGERGAPFAAHNRRLFSRIRLRALRSNDGAIGAAEYSRDRNSGRTMQCGDVATTGVSDVTTGAANSFQLEED